MLAAREALVRRAGFQLRADAFVASAGSLHALVGRNGSGKTTWLHLLCGALRPQAGEVTAFGGPPGPPNVLFLPARPEDAMLGADRRMEVEAALALRGDRAVDASGRRLAAERLLDLPLERADAQAERLYRVLVGLAAQEPLALVLDEPTARIGPDARPWVGRALQRLRSAGLAVVVATHDPDLVRRADHVSIVSDGEVLPGSLQEAVTRGLLRAPELGGALRRAGLGEELLGALAADVLHRMVGA